MKSSDPEADAEEVMRNVDNSGSGSINYTGIFSLKKFPLISIEFLIATIKRENILKRDRLESTFKLLDRVKTSLSSLGLQ